MVPHELASMAPGAGPLTEACHVPLDRRGTPRTCHLVADEHGRTNRISPAPPARGHMREGKAVAPRKACCKVRTPNIPIREDGERAPTYRNPDHAAATTSRRQPRDAVLPNPRARSNPLPLAARRGQRDRYRVLRRCRRAGSSLLPAPSADGALFFPLSVTAGSATSPNQSVLSSRYATSPKPGCNIDRCPNGFPRRCRCRRRLSDRARDAGLISLRSARRSNRTGRCWRAKPTSFFSPSGASARATGTPSAMTAASNVIFRMTRGFYDHAKTRSSKPHRGILDGVLSDAILARHSFDHLVGAAEQWKRHGDAKGFGCLEVDK